MGDINNVISVSDKSDRWTTAAVADYNIIVDRSVFRFLTWQTKWTSFGTTFCFWFFDTFKIGMGHSQKKKKKWFGKQIIITINNILCTYMLSHNDAHEASHFTRRPFKPQRTVWTTIISFSISLFLNFSYDSLKKIIITQRQKYV